MIPSSFLFPITIVKFIYYDIYQTMNQKSKIHKEAGKGLYKKTLRPIMIRKSRNFT